MANTEADAEARCAHARRLLVNELFHAGSMEYWGITNAIDELISARIEEALIKLREDPR